MRTYKRQKGTTLVELILVIALVAIAMVIAFMQKAAQFEEDRAQALGSDLFSYANAVRHYLATNPDVPETTGIIGTNWLKDGAECGVPSGDFRKWGNMSFLPCSFREGSPDSPMFGSVSLTTEIIKEGEQTKVVTTTSPLKIGDTARPDLAGLATVAAAAGTHVSADAVIMSTYGSFSSDIRTGVITLEITNSIDGDLWIRVDNPRFKKSAYFVEDNAPEEREIRNLSRIQNKIGEALNIGRSGGALSGDSVVIDANQSVKGAIAVAGTATLSSNVNIGGHINQVRDITSSGAISGTSMRSPRYYDATGNAYYLAPSGTSVLSNINASNMNTTGTVTTSSLLANNVRLTTNKSANTGCTLGDVARTSQGVLMTCVNRGGNRYVINASWVHGTISAGGACTPGSFAFDASNNLHVCR